MHGARREGPVTRLVALGLELTIGREGPHPRRRHLQDTRYLRGRVGLLLHSRYPTLNPSLAACRKQTLMRVGPQLREIYPYRGLQRHRTIQHHGRMKAYSEDLRWKIVRGTAGRWAGGNYKLVPL